MIRMILTALLLFALMVLLTPFAIARTLTEATIVCDSSLTATLDSGGNPHVFASCTTFDSSGAALRSRRDYDITNQLSAPQKSGLLTILQSLGQFAAQDQSVPTPTPRQTP